MKALFYIFSCLVIFLLFTFISVNTTFAASCFLIPNPANPPLDFQGTITFNGNCFPSQGGTTYQVIVYPSSIESNPSQYATYADNNWNKTANINAQTIEMIFDLTGTNYKNEGQWTIKFCQDLGKGVINYTCQNSQGAPNGGLVAQSALSLVAAPTQTPIPPTETPTPLPIPDTLPIAKLFPDTKCVYQAGENVEVTLTNVKKGQPYQWWWYGDSSRSSRTIFGNTITNDFAAAVTISGNELTQELRRRPNENKHTICFDTAHLQTESKFCTPGMQNTVTIGITLDKPTDTSCSNPILGTPTPPVTLTPIPPTNPLPCKKGLDIAGNVTEKRADIKKCLEVETAIGNIPTDPAQFIKTIFTVLLSMAGGWAVYLIITAGYQYMFSQGDPESVKEAREKITSAIVGLVFMILSLIILRIIGVDIFQLPTFG